MRTLYVCHDDWGGVGGVGCSLDWVKQLQQQRKCHIVMSPPPSSYMVYHITLGCVRSLIGTEQRAKFTVRQNNLIVNTVNNQEGRFFSCIEKEILELLLNSFPLFSNGRENLAPAHFSNIAGFSFSTDTNKAICHGRQRVSDKQREMGSRR